MGDKQLPLNRPSSSGARPAGAQQRFRTLTHQPDGAAADPQYQRMVQDLEALQHRQGWLRGGGAFDKEDLLFLKDRQEATRVEEQRARDRELAAFSAARAAAEQQQQAAAAARTVAAAKQAGRPQGKAPLIVVHCKSRAQEPRTAQPEAVAAAAAGGGAEPAAKRLRLGAADAAGGRGGSSDAEPQQQAQQRQPQQQHPQSACLARLLGGYESDDNSSDEPAAAVVREAPPKQPPKLPPAALLLEQDTPRTIAPLPALPQQQPAGAPPPRWQHQRTQAEPSGWV